MCIESSFHVRQEAKAKLTQGDFLFYKVVQKDGNSFRSEYYPYYWKLGEWDEAQDLNFRTSNFMSHTGFYVFFDLNEAKEHASDIPSGIVLEIEVDPTTLDDAGYWEYGDEVSGGYYKVAVFDRVRATRVIQ